MPQSFSSLPVHLVFSTKYRKPMIRDPVRDSLHRYLATVLKDLQCHPIIINSVEDHIHLLFELSRSVAMSTVVERTKRASSKWIKTLTTGYEDFRWQVGYGAFSVSRSSTGVVYRYIERQREHHRARSFQNEFRTLLRQHHLEPDERHMWD